MDKVNINLNKYIKIISLSVESIKLKNLESFICHGDERN